jgi:hypothetical protein
MPTFVIPAKAGIQTDLETVATARWIPAFAGMTGWGSRVTKKK